MQNKKKSLIALSLVGVLSSCATAQDGNITNTNDPNQMHTIGSASGSGALNGSIQTSGTNSHTTVNFRGNSEMKGGQISAKIEQKEKADGNTGATNTILLQENSVLHLTADNLEEDPKEEANAEETTGKPKIPTTFSILADGSGAKNTISDLTTGTATGSIAGAIIAKNAGINIITNLRNTTLSGAIVADGSGSKNDITLDSRSSFGSYLLAMNKGTNILTLNNDSSLNMNSYEDTEKASVYAIGEGSSNVIKGDTTDSGNIMGVVLAKDKGINTITLSNLHIAGELKAVDGGLNLITLSQGSKLTHITTQGTSSNNTVFLNDTSSIQGYIANLNTALETPAEETILSKNTIVLNDEAFLNLHKATSGANNGSAIYSSSGGTNTISGNSTGNHQITGNITASTGGLNTITLSKLTMTGDITTDGGNNVIKIGNFSSTENSSITGNIQAKNKDGKNNLDFTRVEIKGNILASAGENEVHLKDSKVTGDITAQGSNTEAGKNTLELGNAGTRAEVNGKISAKTKGQNIIEFNNGDVNGGIFAEGAEASNTITLGNQTYTGTIKANITATDSGTNTITVESVNMTGSVIAKNQGKNSITDKNPFNSQSVITGGILAQDNGTNTAILKNINITEGVSASGVGAKNTLTIGGNQNGLVTSNITSSASGENQITFVNYASLLGNILANAGGKNEIKECVGTAVCNGIAITNEEVDTTEITTQTLISGNITADGGENTITLAYAKITGGIIATNSSQGNASKAGKNTIIIATTNADKSLISDVIANKGGSNEVKLGDDDDGKFGVLQGNLIADGDGSKNEVTLKNSSIFKEGYIKANALDNVNQTTNTITLEGTSALNLVGETTEDGLVGYAIYASGKGASNHIQDSGTGQNTILGDIVADNTQNKNTNNQPSNASNNIALKNLTLTGSINAYNSANNTLELNQAKIDGNVLAQTLGTNQITFKANSEVDIAGTFSAVNGGSNTLKIQDNAKSITIATKTGNAFQAQGQGAKNIFQYETDTATQSPVGSITGVIFAEEGGSNQIELKKFDITGDIKSYGGSNSITIGSTEVTNTILGNMIADSANVTDITESTANTSNVVTLNGNATIKGSLSAQGSDQDKKATNEIKLNTDSNSFLSLVSSQIVNTNGENVGSGEDAIFVDGVQSLNKITDLSSATEQSTINGNIYAINGTNDVQKINGNQITLKNVSITGDVIAISGGNNTLSLEKVSFVGDTIAKSGGNNAFTLGMGEKAENKTIGMVEGSITANELGKNEFKVTNIILNQNQVLAGIIASATASSLNSSDSTKNTITLNGASELLNTYLSANQEAILGTISQTFLTKNELALKDTSIIKIIANTDGNAILAKGVNAQNTITDETTADGNSITGNIYAGYSGNNNVQIKKITMTGDVNAASGGTNTINFGNATNSGSFFGSINATSVKQNTQNTMIFTGMMIGGSEVKQISSNNGGINQLTLDQTSVLKNMYLTAQGANDSYSSKNSITLNDANSVLYINTNFTSTTKALVDLDLINASNRYALYATGNNASNIIKVSEKQSVRNKQYHAIAGMISALDSAKNEVNLENLTFKGSVTANNAKNMITISNQGIAQGDLIQAQSAGSNTLAMKETNFSYGGIIAQASQNGNDEDMITFVSQDPIDPMTTTLTDVDGSISSASCDDQATCNVIKLTGDSSFVITGVSLKQAILADGENAQNIITQATTTQTNNSITGNILASNSGKNFIHLDVLTLQGDIQAESGAMNYVVFGKAQEQRSQNRSSFTGDMNALQAQNFIKITNGDILGNIYSNNGVQEITFQTVAMQGTIRVESSDESENSVGNSVNLTDTVLTKSALSAEYSGEMSLKTANTISMSNTSSFAFNAQQNSGYAIKAVGNGATNTIKDTTNGNLLSTITAAQDSQSYAIYAKGKISDQTQEDGDNTPVLAVNDLQVKNVNIIGQIWAQDNAKNTLNFGQEKQTASTQNVDQNTMQSIITASNATNHITLTQFDVSKSALIALVDNSINTLSLKNSTFSGYLVAISSEKSSSNTIELDTNSTLNLIGSQVYNASAAKIGSGYDAIYTEGKNSSNILKITDQTDLVTSKKSHSITGNITAVSGGANHYGFKTITINNASVIAYGNNATNTILIQDSSSIAGAITGETGKIGGIFYVKGGDSSNTFTFKDSSKAENMAMQAIFVNMQTDSSKNTKEDTGAKEDANTNEDAGANEDTGDNATGDSNPSESVTPTFVKNILTFEGSSAFSLVARDVKESITSDSAVIYSGSVLYADGNGSSEGALNQIVTTSSAKSTITGDLIALNGGANVIESTVASKQKEMADTENLIITGDIISQNNGKNTIKLHGGNSPIAGKFLQAYSGGQNSILIDQEGKGVVNFTGGSLYGSQIAIYANGFNSINTIKSSSTVNVTGNIVAVESGINTLKEITTLNITGGVSISAEGNGSVNTIVASGESKLELGDISTIDGGVNRITDNNNSSQTQNLIAGNIKAVDGGQNDVSLVAAKINGDLIADNGSNAVTLGGTIAKELVRSGDSQSFEGNIIATRKNGSNIFDIKDGVQLILHTISADFGSNSVSISKSISSAKINSDITATNGGSNSIKYDDSSNTQNLELTSDLILATDDNSSNTLSFNKINVTGSQVSTQKIQANGTGAKNTIVYQNAIFKKGELVASNGGENDFTLMLANEKIKDTDSNQEPNLSLVVRTSGESINDIKVENISENAVAYLHYDGGQTSVVFAKSKDNTNGDNNYRDGVLLNLNATKANDILKDFRSGYYNNYSSNYAIFLENSVKNYTISGVYVGAIQFLENQEKQTEVENNITLNNGAALLASIATNNNGKLNMTLNQGSKWFVKTSSDTQGSGVVANQLIGKSIQRDDSQNQISSLAQTNTIIDLATGGYDSKYGIINPDKRISADVPSHLTLTIASGQNLDNMIFRLYTDTSTKLSDKIIVNKIGNTEASVAQDLSNSDPILQSYYTTSSLQNKNYHYQEDSANNTLVATVSSDAKNNFHFGGAMNDGDTFKTTVNQGYLEVTTEYIKKTEKVQGSDALNQEVDNYYINSYQSRIRESEQENSYSMLLVNYLVFLSNTNNINKRLGEVRDMGNNHGFWARAFGGQNTLNQGFDVVNKYISTQVGYDYAIPTSGGMHFLGLAFGYGYHSIKSNEWMMNSQALNGALYYSYVRDSGFYSDTVIKYDYIDTKPKTADLNDPMVSQVISLSQEFGYRVYFDSPKRFFLEMQLEGLVGYMMGFNTLQKYSDQTEAQLKGIVNNAFVFRGIGGGVFGYSLKTAKNQTDFRIGAQYVADYNSGVINLEVDRIATASETFGFNQMVMATFGINSHLTKKLRIYAEAGMGFIGKKINQNYVANFGFRYSFGTAKRNVSFGSAVEDKFEDGVKQLDIQTSNTKCNGCNPENGYYLKLIDSNQVNASLNKFLEKYNFRIYDNGSNKMYLLGPYKNSNEANAQKSFADKISQSLTRNPNQQSELYKVKNRGK